MVGAMKNLIRRIKDRRAADEATRRSQQNDQFAMQALAKHKAEGMQLAVNARLIALGVIVILLLITNPRPETLYYVGFAVLFAANGWAQLRVAQVNRSIVELLLLCLDLALLTAVVLVPNPFQDLDAPLEMQYRFSGHTYFFVYLALGTLAYSWRTVRGYMTFGAVIWLSGAGLVWLLSSDHPSSEAVRVALEEYPFMGDLLDPGNIRFDLRTQEIVLFGLVAFILSITVRRFNDLLFQHASMERERANLARYFSPNMVEELSNNDEPLTQIKTQNVAVLFVDIVGFTQYANDQDPKEVIETLREFHSLMERCVFDNNGTLDKFLGDGLMATFGTPFVGKNDAINCLTCAQDMVTSTNQWNQTRLQADKTALKIGIGLHFGPCVMGDIGGDNRLEFAVIGDTVNLASRMESKTRELKVDIALTEEFSDEITQGHVNSDNLLKTSRRFENQEVKGIREPITIIGIQSNP